MNSPIVRGSLGKVKLALNELKRLKINVEPSVEREPLRINLPQLLNSDIIEHTNEFASKEVLPVIESIKWATSGQLPPLPSSWACDRVGWTKYLDSGEQIQVKYPDCSTIVLDTENCVDIGHVPIICVAVSDKFWYSWLNPDIFNHENLPNNRLLTEKNLIPIGRDKIVIVRVSMICSELHRVVPLSLKHVHSYDRP